jgi:EAL domain-containing protein (putative c-di-GMP-specific phosphodiesterase class I)
MSLDDFGTGYSSLSLLKRLPLDKLKIDQSFVRGLPDDKDDLAISTATIAMGKALQLRIIAEGVETAEQMAVLISQGAEGIQGYWVSKPVPSTDFYRFVEEHNMRSTEQFKIERTGHRLPPDLRVVAAANDR